TPESIKRFLDQHASRQLSDVERVAVLRLLELQRHAMLMFTSCGWFFEDLSRIETVQVIQYAGRAVQLARDALGNDVEAHFLELLEKAESNVTQAGNGRLIYEKRVRPAMVDLTNVAAHYAVSSLFEEYGKEPSIYCFRVDVRDYQLREAGRARLGLGRALFTSEITTDSAELSFGVLHLGDHNLNAGVRHHEGEGEYDAMIWEVTGAFESADVPEVVRVMDSQFGSSAYSARSLFRDEQRKVLDRILESTLAEVEASYRSVYEQHYSLMRFLADLGYPLPNALRSATRFVLNTDLRRAFEDEAPSAERVGALVETAQAWELELDTAGLSHSLERTIERVAEGLLAEPADVEALGRFEEVVDIARSLPFGIDQRRAQNAYYAVLRSSYPDLRSRAEGGDESARRWTEQFRRLGDKLQVRVE
ncbi:MAG: DUF3536 domain-containing protein, partial [Chloroflexota bacterium]|nr:DUF3536 domain-containing protein [Chloroflexota bacterium]